MRISCSEDDIAVKSGVSDLASNVLVGETYNESVLGGVVLVLVLKDQSLTSLVVSLALLNY